MSIRVLWRHGSCSAERRRLMATAAAEDTQRLTVLVADAHPLFAQALGRALARRPNLEMLDAFPRSGMQAAYAAVSLQPDVAVVDLWLQEITGLAAIGSIAAKAPQTRVIALGWFHGATEIARALEAGAAGFVSKKLRLVDIAEAIELVGVGRRVVIDPSFRVVKDTAAEPAREDELCGRSPGEAFTPRELEVLRLLGAGLDSKDVASRLGVAHETVRTHLTRVLTKTGARSQLQAVAVARERGYLV